ncbi:hypothetical protein [Bosea sp. 2YAB26]|uniref:hypothetical protein n=1 Tax=Bosea sp. 2YAB26 TaxID=3237478 RepID=UPI003F92683D
MNCFPTEEAQPRTHEVLIPIEGQDLLSRLQAMDTWLTEWDIAYQVAGIDDSAIAIRFPSEQFTRAFAETFGLTQRSLG